MLQWEDSAILLTFIKLPFVIKIFVLSIFEWLFYTGFTVFAYTCVSDYLEGFFYSLYPSQQFFSYVKIGLPGFNQY